MNSLQHFNIHLKRAVQRRELTKLNNQTTTKIATISTAASTPTKNKNKLTDDQYKNILVAKAVTYIRGQA